MTATSSTPETPISDAPSRQSLRQAWLVGNGVAIQLLRQRAIYVIAILTGMFVLGVLIAAFLGVENPETSAFFLNLGMTLAYYCSHVLTLLLMARQIPDELENRTLYPMLARPLERWTLLLGKFAACAWVGVATMLLLTTIVGLATLMLPHTATYSLVLLIQCLILQILSLHLLAALTLLASLYMPQAVAMALVGGWAAIGPLVITYISARTGGLVVPWYIDWPLHYLPDFSLLNVIQPFTDGIPALGFVEFARIVIWAALTAGGVFWVASEIFRRRPL